MDKTSSFSDIFKNSFLAMQGGVNTVSVTEIIINLGVSFFIGMFIFFVYRKTFQGVLYQKSFNVSLVAIAMLLTLIIMTIKGNLILSLGMVGALSVVRFRTPIKDPVDLVFIFWAITIGIANGVGYFSISLLGSMLVAVVLLIMTSRFQASEPYLLILQINKDENESKIISDVIDSVGAYSMKSKSVNPSYNEIIAEIRLRENDTDFVNKINDKYDVQKISLITYSGDLAST